MQVDQRCNAPVGARQRRTANDVTSFAAGAPTPHESGAVEELRAARESVGVIIIIGAALSQKSAEAANFYERAQI